MIYTLTLILDSLCISAMITGVYIATNWPGMIFYTPARYLERRLPAHLVKPIFLCMICMSSVWTFIYRAALHIQIDWSIIVQIPMVAAINVFISQSLAIYTRERDALLDELNRYHNGTL
jgi:uncharacterized membrane protein YfcA